MTRLNKLFFFQLDTSSRFEVSFAYQEQGSTKKNYYRLCYEISELVDPEIGEIQNINGFDFATCLKKEILEKLILKHQLSTIVYSEMNLKVQNTNGVQSYLLPFAPVLKGLSESGSEYETGTYKCTCKTSADRSFAFEIFGFSIPRGDLKADIFMNELIPEVGQTKEFVINSNNKKYTFKAFFVGKTLNAPSPRDSILLFYEQIY